MPHITEGAARSARNGKHRRHIASLAHAKAHEVLALREAQAAIAASVTVEEAGNRVAALVEQRTTQVALMADEVAGHA